MSPEVHSLTWQGHKILAVLDHESACDVIRAARQEVPSIPPGETTVVMAFLDAGGRAALAVNQTGWVRQVEDNEAEVNGCFVLILQRTTGDAARDEEVLRAFLDQMAI